MIDRLFNPLKSSSYFLFGARGTGKSYLLRHLLSGSPVHYIDLLNSDYYDQLSIRPQSLLEIIAANKDKKIVIIDEVQKIPSLLDAVHKSLEEMPSIQYILTGSSARKLKRGSANMLAGRAAIYELHPLSYLEIDEDFDLNIALSFGSLPKVWDKEMTDEERKDYLRAYARSYLKEEILEEQLIRKLEPFQRFLPIAAQSSGKALNYSKIAADVGVAPQTIQSYFDILEDTLIGYRLSAYHGSVRKQEKQEAKFYLFDLGILSALERTLEVPMVEGTYAFGRRFEHFIIQEIYKLSRYYYPDNQFYHYQTKGGREIDLIIDCPGEKLVLIEIKSKTHIQPDDVRHLNALVDDFPNAKAFCLSRDPIEKKIDKTICFPWKSGIKQILN
ncbi:MAG: ATP-binding protein, partial [Bdellovibrionales bacterium]|nr:ATP-binding protein [Bdellovibrionales bacterium]